jgi:hypothetical protein
MPHHLIGEIAAHGHFDLVFGTKSTTYSAAAIELGVAALATETLHLRHRHAGNAISDSAARTSSSLKGLMMAVTNFISLSPNSCVPILH